MIALDLDGTLIGKGRKVSKENIKAINMAREAGMKICIDTGRSISRVLSIAKEIGSFEFEEFVICLNGGGIYKLKKDFSYEIIKEVFFEIEDVNSIYEKSKELKINCFSYIEDPKISYVIKKGGLFIWFMKKITNRKLIIFNNKNIKHRAYKVIACGKKNNIQDLKKFIENKNYESYAWSYVSKKTMNIEISPPNVDKVNALKIVSDIYNIVKEEVIYFGDGENDRRSIEWAGVGVAMENASHSIKSSANEIAPHHKKNGVSYKIHRFID